MRVFETVRMKAEDKDNLCKFTYGIEAQPTLRDTMAEGAYATTARLRDPNVTNPTDLVHLQHILCRDVVMLSSDERHLLLRRMKKLNHDPVKGQIKKQKEQS